MTFGSAVLRYIYNYMHDTIPFLRLSLPAYVIVGTIHSYDSLVNVARLFAGEC